MTKIAFCFPGQGSFEAGMGRDIERRIVQKSTGLLVGPQQLGYSSPNVFIFRRRANDECISLAYRYV